MKNLLRVLNATARDFGSSFGRLSLRWKIYLSLTAIVIPISVLVFFIQSTITRPLLEEEVRTAGISLLRSLASDIRSSHLLNNPKLLEDQLIEISWLHPGIMRLDVFAVEGSKNKFIASNISDDTAPEFAASEAIDTPRSALDRETRPHHWDIIFPIKDRHSHLNGYLHLQLSLNLVDQVVATFAKISILGALLSTLLLISLLSYYLRLMIENEAKLKQVENTNVALNEQLTSLQRELHLKDKLALMGQLTASFAHEIGTPLNSLSGHVQLLKSESNFTTAQNRLDIISSQINRIESIVKEFLQSTHAPPQQKQLVDLRELIGRMRHLISPRLLELSVKCEVAFDEKLEPIRIVPSDLEQVLLNLANNALDSIEEKNLASPHNKRVENELRFDVRIVQTKDLRKSLLISVIDSGRGIPSNQIKDVFKPFYTTKAKDRGTGLGLSICQQLVKKCGGRFELESELGKGTRALVTLPYDNA